MSTLDYLLSPKAVRERSRLLYDAALKGQTHWQIHPERSDAVIDRVVKSLRGRYPDLKIPFHSRWGHFKVGGTDRAAGLAWSDDARERARQKIDLVVVSVLLDAGAGTKWAYHEGSSHPPVGRSEGLAVASLRMFEAGAFSAQASRLRADATALERITAATIAQGFQVSEHNPLVGVEGRAQLLASLGRALQARIDLFPDSRPGGLVDWALNQRELNATQLLRAVLEGLGSIWPGRLKFEGVDLGDCWKHPWIEAQGLGGYIPFHKLSQWLTYSLFEPLEEAGIRVPGVEQMTGLPEYRNGGLLMDSGWIQLKDPAHQTRAHKADSLLVIEWRALTVTLLDEIAVRVRKQLGLSEAEFPLAKVLEGGTWWAGREIARELRADGSPPLQIVSDGTVF